MNPITIRILDIEVLNSIQNNLSNQQPLTPRQQQSLNRLLSQVCSTNNFPIENDFLDEPIEVYVWDMKKSAVTLKNWETLFNNLPGWDYCPFCNIVDEDNPEMLRKNIIVVATFAPSYAYNSERKTVEGYEVHLKGDGTAKFWFPTFEDAEQYPELYNFKGSWKEAYLLLIETLKKGWPMEEFPEELKPFLKK